MSSTPLEAMLAEILARGRAAGLTHAAIAARAGLTPETLSRLRHKGDCRLATLLALADAVGCRLELRGPTDEAPDGVASPCRTDPPAAAPAAAPAPAPSPSSALPEAPQPGQRPRHLL